MRRIGDGGANPVLRSGRTLRPGGGRIRRGARVPACLAALAPVPATAHPHIFVEASVELVVADGALQGVRLSWLYDDFFSLLLTTDLGIDDDGDMALTEAELAILTAAVLDWPPDYAGDLSVIGPAGPVDLAPREGGSVALEEGRVRESHYRPLAEPLPAPVTVQVYDPYYYVAYEIVGDPSVSGEGCVAALVKADLDAAYAMVDGLLGGRAAADVGPEEDFPMVGDAFADSVVLTCGG